MSKILIVDDEENIRSSLSGALRRQGHEAVTAASVSEATKYITARFDLILLDVMLGDGNGIDLLIKIRKSNPDQLVVMISGQADVMMAVNAIHAGAYDFIEKPLSLDRVLVTIDNAARTNRLIDEKNRLSSIVYPEFIGEHESIKKLKQEIEKSAGIASRFLILGENGSGKELVAHYIHRAGRYPDGPYVAVNCAAIPSELVESELFGHTKGAFTNAVKARTGKFAEADGGSIFLDEIAEMSLSAQAKILRAIETKQVTPVGSNEPVAVDCSIIAASNKNLDQLVTEGKFRQDLLYRLNVVVFNLSPLRERRTDIKLLAEFFLQRFARDTGQKQKLLSTGAATLLAEYDFPGNVRELKNIMERLNIYCDHDTASREDLQGVMPATERSSNLSLKEAVNDFEMEFIRCSIARNDNNMAAAARELGLERSHLYKKLRRSSKKQ